MIVSKKIKINKRHNRFLKYYSDLGYDVNSDFFLIDVEDLLKTSKNIVTSKCDYCASIVEIPYNQYTSSISRNGKFACSIKCARMKSNETTLEKYGKENVFQTDSVILKSKETMLKKYGVDNASKSKDILSRSKKTNIDRYGVDSYSKTIEFKEKVMDTNIRNYGVDHPMKSDISKEKAKNTFIRNYGVDHPMKLNEYIEKRNNTILDIFGSDNITKSDYLKIKNIELYGKEYFIQSDEFKLKSKETNIDRYGVDSYSKTIEFKEKVMGTNLERYKSLNIQQNEDYRIVKYKICENANYIKYLEDSISLFRCDLGKNHNFEIRSDNYSKRVESNIPLCTICYPIGEQKSIKEKELLRYVESIYGGEIITGYRDVIEIDVYLPQLKIGFEFNGIYWHSELYKDKNYHINKTSFFEERGIRIIHIWEDDWDNKKEILKSQIKNWINLIDTKIYARSCKVVEIHDVNLSKEFLNTSHIQGNSPSTIKISLMYNNDIVSLMTFDKNEGRKKMKDGEWNLSRFCSKLNTTLVGGASKLINYFINKYNPTRIISYSDRSWSSGNLYLEIGFSLVYTTGPDYKYIVNNERKHKGMYRKKYLTRVDNTESNLMLNNKIYKIWDCGKFKFEKIFKRP